MKKIFTFVLSFSLLLTSTLPFAQKSEAAVGLLKKHKTTKVLGGIATGGGLVFSTLIYAAATNSGTTGWAAVATGISAGVYVSLGLAVAIVGAVVLDENNQAEITFMPLGHIPGIDQNITSIYNAELDQLNAITLEIGSAVELNPEIDTRALWLEYGKSLSPETLQVARSIAQGFLSK